jgi:arylsulfatase A-like enzyme
MANMLQAKTRRQWAGCFGATVLAVLMAATAAGRAQDPDSALDQKLHPERPPNIIFILADDLGYGDLGCYGQTKIRTPHLDQLAAEGMRFTQGYAGSTVCAPSRAALLTGLHTGHTRIRGNGQVPLALEDLTVAEVLKRKGYQTGVIGKWGLGLENSTGTPHRQGFDEWLGYLDQVQAHNYYPTYLYRSSVSGNCFDVVLPLEGNFDGKQTIYSHDYFTMAATNYLRISKYRPFFLYLAYTLPHANPELTRKTGNGMQVPDDVPYSEEAWPQPEKNKAAMITRLDQSVGVIMEQLRHLKIETNTIVFFSSDNGPHQAGGNDPAFFKSSGPFHGIKRDLYEGGIRVPLIVHWPGHIKPGSVSDQIFAFWDFLPTAAELAGVKPPADIDGISVLPALLGQKQTNQHAFLYWEFRQGKTKQAVRMGGWKAVRLAPSRPLELYDLRDDPGESRDVAKTHPDIVEKIEAYLKSARTESKEWPLAAKASAMELRPSGRFSILIMLLIFLLISLNGLRFVVRRRKS